MANAAYSHDREDEARSAMLRQWGINPRAPSADVIPIRKPLGLGIVPGDDAPSEHDASSYDDGLQHGPVMDLTGFDRAALDAAASVELVYISLNAAGSMLDTATRKLKERCAGLETEIARLTAKVAEAQAKVGELSFVSERLRIEIKARKACRARWAAMAMTAGRASAAREEPKAEQGREGPRPVSWDIDAAAFAVTPLMSDGRRGPTLHLRALFEEFDAQINDADAAEEHDAAASSRAALEREVALARQGAPPR